MFPPELGLRVRHWQSLSPLGPGTLDRGSFRVELEDGSTVKVRRLADVERAEQAFARLHSLTVEGFPRPLARHGRHLVEPWIEGLEAPPPVADAARMLARLHQAEPGPPASTRGRRETTLAQLEQLAQTLTPTDVARLKTAVETHDPGTARTGIVHLDFCAENLVVDAQGRLWSVDNEWLDVGALDYDLARTLYRWPEAGPAFLDAYGSESPCLFWRIAAVTASATLRLRFGLARPEVPLAELRRLAKRV